MVLNFNSIGICVSIIIKGIRKRFMQGGKELFVLRGVNAEFEKGKSYAITGVSGTGKSTLLHILAGLDQPTEGYVYFDKKNISRFSTTEEDAFLNKSIGLVFQSPYLISELSVLENCMVPGLIGQKSDAACKEKALTILEKVGLQGKEHASPDSLSGGEQQRVAIARAIFNNPEFLLADEPTGNLDIETGQKIVDLLLQCKEKWGMGIIISSHDSYVAHKMEHVLRLENGVLIKE